jgi:broad specificity phosphatase PhoE
MPSVSSSRCSTEILLLRHGQSTWNADGRWQGLADPPLSSLGREQAFAAVKRLGSVDDIVSSDLQRASQTAEILSEGIGVGPVLLDDRLRERDAGEWTGLTRRDIDERWPGALSGGTRPKGYEPDDDVIERVLAALTAVHVRAGSSQVLVVAHGGVVRAIERHLGAEDGLLPNLAGRWLRVTGVTGATMTLRERVLLLDPNEITVTSPNHL